MQRVFEGDVAYSRRVVIPAWACIVIGVRLQSWLRAKQRGMSAVRN
jgi:hypothetical protein